MNYYVVDKKKFIKDCEQAIKNVDQEILDNSERGNLTGLNVDKASRNRVFTALRAAKMSFVQSANISEEFLTLLNYCLTSK